MSVRPGLTLTLTRTLILTKGEERDVICSPPKPSTVLPARPGVGRGREIGRRKVGWGGADPGRAQPTWHRSRTYPQRAGFHLWHAGLTREGASV